MTTKDQERAALKQITKIVESLGEQSYIGTALEGCLEDADQNIYQDAALSMKSRWVCAEQKAQNLEVELLKARAESKSLIAQADRAQRTAVDPVVIRELVDSYREIQTTRQAALDSAGQELIEMIGTVPMCDIKFIQAINRIEALKDKIACFDCLESQIDLLDTAQQAARG